MYFLDNDLKDEIISWFIDFRMNVVLESNINLIVPLCQSSWVTRCIVNSSNTLKEFFFFPWAADLNSGLKLCSNVVIQALLIHLQSTNRMFCIILKSTRIFRMVNEHWLQLKVTKRVSLPFEALKSGTDFSSLPMKVLDDIFFQYKAVLSKLKTCCIV